MLTDTRVTARAVQCGVLPVPGLDSGAVQVLPLATSGLALPMESATLVLACGPAVVHAVPVAEPLAAVVLPTKRPAWYPTALDGHGVVEIRHD